MRIGNGVSVVALLCLPGCSQVLTSEDLTPAQTAVVAVIVVVALLFTMAIGRYKK